MEQAYRNDQKLQQGITRMKIRGWVCDGGECIWNRFDDDEEDIDNNVCDFRKDGVKRQEGPKRARETTAQKMKTGIKLRKFLQRIAQ
jgi:hypothetical protein